MTVKTISIRELETGYHVTITDIAKAALSAAYPGGVPPPVAPPSPTAFKEHGFSTKEEIAKFITDNL